MLNTIVEDSPSNRLPNSTVNTPKCKYIQHIAIFNQNSSPFHESLLILNPEQLAQSERLQSNQNSTYLHYLPLFTVIAEYKWLILISRQSRHYLKARMHKSMHNPAGSHFFVKG